MKNNRHHHVDTLESDEETRYYLIDESCCEDYRQMFGQRSRREKWGKLEGFIDKDLLPGEEDFRVKWEFRADPRMRPRTF